MDDTFDAEGIPEALLEAGFHAVERFTKYFPREDDSSKRQQGVKDKRVMSLCNSKGWLLVTNDGDMRITHVEEIKNFQNLAILATAHNSAPDPFEWVAGLCKCKAAIERRFKKQPTPWYGQFTRQGQMTVCKTITVESYTRRVRPREKDLEAKSQCEQQDSL